MLNIIYINCGAAYAPAPQDTLPDEFVQFIDGCMPCQPGQVNIFVFGDSDSVCANLGYSIGRARVGRRRRIWVGAITTPTPVR